MSSHALPAKAEQLFRYLFEQASLGIAVEDLDGKILLANPALCSMLGYHDDELAGMTCSEFANPEDSRDDWALFQQLRTGVIDHYTLEKRYVTKQGVPLWGRLNVSLLKTEDEESPLVFAFVEDITEHKQAEEELRRSEERFRLAAQAGKMYAYEWDPTSDVVVRSEEYVNILGLSDPAERLTRQELAARLHPDDRAKFISSVDQLTPEHPRTQITYRVLRPDGAVIWLEKSGRAFFDVQGRLVRVMGMVADITERKKTEERLREYENAVEGSEEMIAVVDREYRYLIANRKFLRARNLTKEKVIGRLVPEVLNKQVFEEVVKQKLDECFAGKVVKFEMRYTYPGLGERDLSVSYFPIEGATGVDRAVCILQDITERKQVEEALKKSEEKFSKAFQQSPMALTLTSVKDHRYIDVNETFERITGWRRDEVIGRTPFDIGLWVDSTQRLGFVKRVLAEGAIRDCEVHFRSRDGTQRVGLGAGELIQIESEPCILSVIADITERKLAEEALSGMSRKLIEAQEQERTRVARELHDDIGQRLAMLAIDLERLQQNPVVLSAEARSRVEELQKRASELSTDIQSMSHELHSSKLEYLGIVAAMKSFTKEFGAQQNLEIDFQSHDLPSPVPADISLCLFRVLQEALHNSAKHSGVRRFAVRLWGTSDEIHLTVMDAGIGFNREAAKTGRGLGLVSMKERLKLVNGTLSIDTQPKRGTTIHARVPLISRGDSMHAAG
jgi:PAS domain S-box-containing protein